MKKFLVIISIVIICLVGFTWLFLPSSTQIQFPNIKDLLFSKENADDYSSNNTIEAPEIEAKQVSPKVEEIYNYIKGKTFKGNTATQRTGHGAIEQYEYLTFNPISETEGDVHSVVELEEWGLGGGGKRGGAKNSAAYHIREDGKIIFGSCVLEKSGASLKSNLKTNEGYPITYRSTYK